MNVLKKWLITLIVSLLIILSFTTKVALANTTNGQVYSKKNNEKSINQSNNEDKYKLQQIANLTTACLEKGQVDDAIKHLEAAQIQYANKGELIDEDKVTLSIIAIGLDYQKYTIVVQYGLITLQNLNKLYIKTGKKSYIKSIETVNYILATVFNMEGELSEGKEYFTVAQNIASKYNINLTDSEFIKSNYYYYQNNFEMAKQCAIEGIINAKYEKENYLSEPVQIMYLVKAQIKLGELGKAENNLNYILENLNGNEQIVRIQYYYYYGEIYQDKKEWKKSINDYLIAYKYLKNKKLYLIDMDVLEGLAEDYSNIGEYKNSCKYYTLYVKEGKKFDESKEKVNTTMLISLNKNNPQNILNEIYMKNTKIKNEILLIFVLAGIILSLIFACKYFKKLKNEKKLREELNLDSLTRAYNRRYAISLLNKYSKNKKQYSLAMIDIDNYKSVNDKYGHIFGDEVLVKITRTMMRVVGENVSVIRYGGEEFLLIIESKDIEYSYKIVENVRLAIESLEWIHGNTITISIGLVHYSIGKDVLELVDKADELLYKAKANGKNRIEYNKEE